MHEYLHLCINLSFVIYLPLFHLVIFAFLFFYLVGLIHYYYSILYLLLIYKLKQYALILWPPDVKNWLTGKDPDAEKDWRQEEKGMTEDDMFGWHHWLDGHEFQQALGVGDGWGGLACCSPWGHSQKWLSNWTELKAARKIKFWT